jgi:TadE-like protein
MFARIKAISGQVAIEFAFSMLFLVPLIIGLAELGMATYQSMQVYAAVEAGAMYAQTHGWDEAKIIKAVEQAFGDTPPNAVTKVKAIPPPTHFCGCPTGTTIVETGTPPCPSDPKCANGNPQREYIEINAWLLRRWIIVGKPFKALPEAFTAKSIVRVP